MLRGGRNLLSTNSLNFRTSLSNACQKISQSAALVGSTWWWCYWGSGRTSHAQPRNLFTDEHMPKSMLLNALIGAPVISNGIKRRAVRALISLERVSRNSKPVMYLEQKMPSVDATRVCISYAEAKLGRLFVKPLTVPLRVWLSWKGTRTWKRLKSHSAYCDGEVDGDTNATTPGMFRGDTVLLMKRRDTVQLLDSTIIRKKCNSIFGRECTDFHCNHARQ